MPRRVCTKCDGDGYQWTAGDEFEPPIKDACYRCGTEGFISEEQWQAERLERLAEALGAIATERERVARDANPDGEDWAFCAAENQCSVYEYGHARHVENTLRVQGELKKLDSWFLAVLVDQIVPDNQPTEEQYRKLQREFTKTEPQPQPQQPVIGLNLADPPENDDIPF